MYRIGVISDTHGLLREEVKEVLKTCQVILHGGDIGRPGILDELSAMASLYAVRGNCDKEWASFLRQTQRMELFGLRFLLIHNKKMIRETLSDRDIVIYGHSHKYQEQWQGTQLWLNPGSCGPRRFSLPVTMAVLEVEADRSYRVRRIDLGTPEGGVRQEKLPAGKEKEIIRAIMKEMEKGKSVPVMAAKHQISENLTEQICRIIVTHPGVDADGIFNRVQIVRGDR